MAQLFARLLDQAVNRLGGVYTGFEPRRPKALVIPQFVTIESRIPSLIEAVAAQVDMRRVRRPLVLTDPVTWDIAGRELFEDLEAAGLKPCRATVRSNAYPEAEHVLEEMSATPRFWSEADEPWDRRLYGPKIPAVVFGVGGGTVMDMAKIVALQLHVPCVTVPTSLANDGIASPFAVIRPERPGAPANVTVRTNTPLGVIIDLGRIKPRTDGARPFFEAMMRAGIGDAVSNLTSTLDWALAARLGKDRLDYLAFQHARSAGEVVLFRIGEGASLEDDDLVLTLAAGLVSSGEAMSRVGSSRPASGFEHKFYHAFQNILRFPSTAAHGVLVAVGSLVAAAEHGRWLEPMRAGFARAGLPVDAAGLAELGIGPDQVEEAIRASVQVKPDRYTILEHAGPEALVARFREVFQP